MKKLIVAAIIIFAVAVSGLVFFLSKNKNDIAVYNGNRPLETATQSPNDKKTSIPKENGPYVGDDFSIVAPSGWIQTQLPSTLVSFQDPKESQPEGSAAAKVHFKSYIAVSFDNAQGKTLDEITRLVKQQTQSVVPTVSFDSTSSGIIDDQPADFLEASLSQQNIEFKILIAVVMKEDKYFTVSGNTTVSEWPQYRDVFYDTANSLKFKK